MSEEALTLAELLDVSIGTPPGTVNFPALHALLHALLRQLGLRELKTRWGGSPSGPATPVGPLQVEGGVEREERAASASDPGSSPGTPAAEDQELRSRIQSCEDSVSQAMRLIQQLQEQEDVLRDEVIELQQQQQMFAETVAAVETRCHGVDDLQESVKSLRDTLDKCPQPEELRGCVTWDEMQSVLLRDREDQEEFGGGGAVDGPPNSTLTSSPRSVNDSVRTTAPRPPARPGDIFQEERSTRTLPEDSSVRSASWKSRNLELYSDTAEALRSAVRLEETLRRLEAGVAALEEGKVDHSQLTELRDAIASKESLKLTEQLSRHAALISSLMSRQEESEELVNGVKTTMLHLQTECENLQETSRSLQEETADRGAQDKVTQQLTAMFQELLLRVTGQEQDWHKEVHKLSTEMEHKPNRTELDSVKKQLEERWRSIQEKLQEKLQSQGAPEHEDAAGIRKRLVDRFHCLSCDRPVVKHTPGPILVTLPSSPAFPSHRSIRPFTVYALERVRQHYRSERLTQVTDYSHVTMTRSCGGGHTVTSAGQRRSGLKQHILAEVDAGSQSEEVDIVGLDGHVYRGRLNGPSAGHTDTKLPAISRDGPKTSDRTRTSPTHRPAASPEAGLASAGAHSGRSNQCSRSASSSSTRDWPLSTPGGSSQSSVAPTSAAAARSPERADDLRGGL